jgi:ABC-type sulfate transport system substrate-binding protein
MRRFTIAAATALALVAAPAAAQQAPTTLLNASYDIARELFVAVNAAFAPKYKATDRRGRHGRPVAWRHVAPGARHPRRPEADVVTFNQVTDIDFLVDRTASSRPTGRASSRTTPRPTTRCRPSSCAPATRRASRTGAISSATT